MKIETSFVGRWIFVANGEDTIDKQSQSVEGAERIRARGRGGAGGGSKGPQCSNQGARSGWLLDICPQPLNADARRSPAQSRETRSYSLRRGLNGVAPLRGDFFGGHLTQRFVLLVRCQVVAAVE